jgi:hypothetical protein
MRKLIKPVKRCLEWMLIFVLVFLSARFKAQDHCAWLNEATAAGVLNGPVTLGLETTPDDQNICVFTNLKTGKNHSALRIMVQPLKDVSKAVASHESLCTSVPVALKAIGNEAVSCSVDVGYSRGEQVIGRVRDRLFIVTISSTMAHDPSATRKLLQEKARTIAEQIAGALF